MSTSMERSLVINALRSAIRSRQSTSGTIFHSDRGSQYASEDFRNLLKVSGMRASMSRKAECWDNACVESFFGSMNRELGDHIWESRAIAQAMIFDYIEIWYDRKRRHSTLGYVSPEDSNRRCRLQLSNVSGKPVQPHYRSSQMCCDVTCYLFSCVDEADERRTRDRVEPCHENAALPTSVVKSGFAMRSMGELRFVPLRLASRNALKKTSPAPLAHVRQRA